MTNPTAEQRLLAAIHRRHVRRSEIKPILDRLLPGSKFTLRSISFQDLARDSVQEVIVDCPQSFDDLYERRRLFIAQMELLEHTLQVRFKGDMFS